MVDLAFKNMFFVSLSLKMIHICIDAHAHQLGIELTNPQAHAHQLGSGTPSTYFSETETFSEIKRT